MWFCTFTDTMRNGGFSLSAIHIHVEYYLFIFILMHRAISIRALLQEVYRCWPCLSVLFVGARFSLPNKIHSVTILWEDKKYSEHQLGKRGGRDRAREERGRNGKGA